MDWRNRCYYLARLNETLFWWQKGHDDYGKIYTSSVPILKNNVPTIKFSEPYDHFVNSTEIYDGNIEGIGYVQMMISCNKKHEETLLYYLNLLKQKHPSSIKYIKLSKEKCGQ